jgi:chaperone modulatory protein CbpM
MRIELSDAVWLNEQYPLSAIELAELSGLSEAEIYELVDDDVIKPMDADAAPLSFGAQHLLIARTARRLRDDFDLSIHGVALALTLLDRVHDLEAQLCDLRARLPRRMP